MDAPGIAFGRMEFDDFFGFVLGLDASCDGAGDGEESFGCRR